MANRYTPNNEQRRQQVQELTKQLEEGTRAVFESTRYEEYLRVMGKFSKYSVRNTILIAMQRPDASLVAGYSAWQTNFGRQVNKGEHAIKILAPMTYTATRERDMINPDTQQPMIDDSGRVMKEQVEVTIPSFRVTNVFDVKQTSGRPLPTIVDDLEGSVQGYRDFVEALRRVAPVPIQFEDMEGKDGYYHQVEQRIAINDDLSERQTMAAMIHEIAHAKLHALDPDNLKESAKARGKDQRTMEVEAESISFVVNSHFGIDTSANSLGYVASWSKNKELPELHASLQIIKDTAAEMIDSIEMELMEIRHVYVEKSEALEAFDQGEHVFDSPEKGMLVPARRRDISDADEGKFFRMQREEWKSYKSVQAEMDLVPAVTTIREARLLLMQENSFGIYQVNPETKGREYEYMNFEFVERHNLSIDRGDYNLIYTAGLQEGDTLDSIFERFNIERPEDFRGHSLSISDIVVMNREGEVKAYFVDSFGFQEVPEFLEEMLMPDTSLEQAVFQIADRYIEMHQSDGGYDYSIYDAEYKLLDGGLYESDIGIITAARDVATDLKEPTFNTETEQYERREIQGEVSAGDRLYRLPAAEQASFLEKAEQANQIIPAQTQDRKYQPLRKVEELKERNYNMIDEVLNNGFGDEEKREALRQIAEQYQQATNASLSYFAAACEEYHDMEPCYKTVSFPEAVERYKEILADPRLRHMGNGMGIVLHDPTLPDYSDSELTLIKGQTILGSNLDLVETFLLHPLVQEVLVELRETFPGFAYEPPMSVLKAVFPENMTAQEIATGLINLAEDFDLYDFRDKVDHPEQLQEEVAAAISEGRGMEYAPFLNDVIEESPMLRYQAEILLERLRAFTPEPEKAVEAEKKVEAVAVTPKAEQEITPKEISAEKANEPESTPEKTKTAKTKGKETEAEKKPKKKGSIHKRLKENKEKLEKQQGKEKPQKGVELA